MEKKKCAPVRFEGVQRGFLSERKGKVIPGRGAEDEKGAGTNSAKCVTRRQKVSEAGQTVREGV